MKLGLQDVTAALQRLQQQLKKNGHAGQGVEADLAAVQSLLLSPAFRSALTIHSKVQEVWCCGQPTLPAHTNVQQLVTEVSFVLEFQFFSSFIKFQFLSVFFLVFDWIGAVRSSRGARIGLTLKPLRS